MKIQEDDLPASSVGPKNDPSRRFIWIIAAMLVVGVGVAISGRPAYRFLKALRGLKANIQLEALLDAGRWDDETSRLLRLANKLAPDEPPVWHSTARYYSHFKNSQGLAYWQRYINSKRADLDDRREYIRLAQVLSRLDLSRAELLELEKINPNDREADLLEVNQLLLEQKPVAAVYLAQQLLNRHPDDSEVLSMAGRVFSRSSDFLLRIRGQTILRALLRTHQVDQTEAALALAFSEGALSADRRLALDLVRKKSGPTAADLMVEANLGLLLEPERSGEIFADQVRRVSERPLSEKIEIADWLLHRSQPAMTLDLLPLDVVREDRTGLQVRANALVMLNQWTDFEKLTSESHLPWLEWQRSCNGAILAWHQKRNDQVVHHLEFALNEINGAFTPTMEVAKVAELTGHPILAVRALERLLAFPPLAHEAATDILRLVAPLNDADLSLEALRTLNRLHPEDALVRHEFLYVRLLRGERLTSEEVAFLRKQADNDPAQPVWRATLALSELKVGRPEAAWGVFEEGSVDWSKSSPRCKMIQSLVLAANNSREASARVWRTVNVSMLKRQEQSLAGSILQ